MMKARIVVIACLTWPLASLAGPGVVVDRRAPFTAGELDDALSLRGTPRRDIRVERHGDALVIQVGDVTQTVTIAAGDSREAARVIAMVIVALDGSDRRAQPDDGVDREMPPEPVAVPVAAPPEHSRFAARLTIGWGRDDDGVVTNPLTAAMSFAVTPVARLVASASLMKAATARRQDAFIPYRLGFEGRAGGAGLELGAFVVPETDCFGARTAGYGGYAAGRVYVPITSRYQLVLEANGYWVVDGAFGCDMDNWPIGQPEPDPYVPGKVYGTLRGKSYGGALGAGVEWQL